jgi:hypothetical protein
MTHEPIEPSALDAAWLAVKLGTDTTSTGSSNGASNSAGNGNAPAVKDATSARPNGPSELVRLRSAAEIARGAQTTKPAFLLEEWMTGRYSARHATKDGVDGSKDTVVDYIAWDGCPACQIGPIRTRNDEGRCLSCGKGTEELWAAAMGGNQAHHASAPRAKWDDAVSAVDDQAFWRARPYLTHIHTFARARLCSPWAVLGVVLARVAATEPPKHVLPAIVGGQASLNLFVALVGPSGSGKGAAHAAAQDAVKVGHVDELPPGSGEGLTHLFAYRGKRENEITRTREAVLFNVPEIDTLAALGTRNASTLMPQLRKAWSGETLGFTYADPTKSLQIESHSYRLCMTVGVQPGRANALLDDEAGGTPQRFLWLPATDRDMPDVAPLDPTPIKLRMLSSRETADRVDLDVADVARDVIVAARRANARGDVDALDGHKLLCQLKTAAALGRLDGRRSVTDEDWQLAEFIMDISDRTRAGIVQTLAGEAEAKNAARGRMEGKRAMMVAAVVAEDSAQQVAEKILHHLEQLGDQSWAKERKRLRSALRPFFEDAVDLLVDQGFVEVVDAEQGGKTIRLLGA